MPLETGFGLAKNKLKGAFLGCFPVWGRPENLTTRGWIKSSKELTFVWALYTLLIEIRGVYMCLFSSKSSGLTALEFC